MSRNQRILIILGAVVVVVVAFVVLQPSDDDDAPDSPTTATVTQTVSPQGTTPTQTVPPATTPTETTPVEPEIEEVEVEGGQPAGGVQKLTFEKGDRIRFRVRSDTADEIHVHGYNVTRALPANRAIEVAFEADLEGVFEVELHGSGNQIAELTVEP